MSARNDTDAGAPIAVIGIGNVLLGDDGFGPYVVELLQSRWSFPSTVALIDAGTPGLDLVSYLLGREVVILVDAIAADGQPGELRVYSGAELQRLPLQPRVSPHDPAVQEALWTAQLAGFDPQVILIGAIPLATETGAGLSPTLRDTALDAAVLVVRELREHDIKVTTCRSQATPSLWWDAP